VIGSTAFAHCFGSLQFTKSNQQKTTSKVVAPGHCVSTNTAENGNKNKPLATILIG